MNTLEIQKGIVDALYDELNSLDAPALGKRISSLMDEQPQLMGFLFNLDDDFSEEGHTFLLKSAIVIRDVFISAGIPLDTILNTHIEAIIEERVKLYDVLEENEENDLPNWKLKAYSPSLFNLIINRFADIEPTTQATALLIDAIIGLYEEAAASQQDKNKKNA